MVPATTDKLCVTRGDFFFFFWNKVCFWFNRLRWPVAHHCAMPMTQQRQGYILVSQLLFTTESIHKQGMPGRKEIMEQHALPTEPSAHEPKLALFQNQAYSLLLDSVCEVGQLLIYCPSPCLSYDHARVRPLPVPFCVTSLAGAQDLRVLVMLRLHTPNPILRCPWLS